MIRELTLLTALLCLAFPVKALDRDALRRHLGMPVVRRYSGGGDIAAACGLLAGGA